MATTILRFEKIKSRTSISRCASHINRFSKTPNANPEKYFKNEILIGNSRILDSLDYIYKKYKITPRKNSVLAMECLMTLSPESFDGDISIEKFKTSSIDYLNKYFKGRCLNATLHLDESTPHIHAIIVPLVMKKNKAHLSARDCFSPSRLSIYQRTFFDHMKLKFNLIPPNHGSKSSHKKVSTFYDQLNNNKDKLVNDSINHLKLDLENKRHEIVESYVESLLSSLDKYIFKLESKLKNEFGGLAMQYRDKWKDSKQKCQFDVIDTFSASKEQERIAIEIEKHMKASKYLPNQSKGSKLKL
ncbi:plasmid recombination protein [Vibrio cyclitrophicus]|uniref:plasmid recombination protein n=1 Tax=Vibrio cyclitrophicus TaxID=47951 RepID=UPI000C85FC5B|nr:plasmid recombination protein [Vibrio cyclitrophicus]